jgi:hypothetical protein
VPRREGQKWCSRCHQLNSSRATSASVDIGGMTMLMSAKFETAQICDAATRKRSKITNVDRGRIQGCILSPGGDQACVVMIGDLIWS